MSDGMAFLTGAAFAGVAVLFLLRGGPNLGATNLPSTQPLLMTPTNSNNPYNPYGVASPSLTPASPGAALYNSDQQRLEAERLKMLLEQQRTETEQLKAQLQNQQSVIEKLTAQNDPNARVTWSKPGSTISPQQQENPMLSGIVWALGGMAITVSGGVVVVGALAVLSRQQRPPRTTYVVQQPYTTALPPTVHSRRRTEAMPPQLEERRIDYVEYDR